MNRVFIDTGAFVAIGDRRDAHHDLAMRWLREYTGRYLTSGDVLDEAATRLRYDGGLPNALRLRDLVDALEQRRRLDIVWSDRERHRAAWEVLARYPTVGLSFTDAMGVSIVQEHRCDAVFGFDQDFVAAGIALVP